MSNEIEKIIKRDIRRMSISVCVVLLFLLGYLMFSPIASPQHDIGITRDAFSCLEIDSLIRSENYRGALCLVDSMIDDEEKDLPRFAFFDRYLPENEQYDVLLARAAIYKLQWKRIEVLRCMNDKDNLRKSLEEYTRIIGYNLENAKALLNQTK